MLFKVSVNVVGHYDIEAKNEKAAKATAITTAKNGDSPDEISYEGEGIDNCVQLDGDEVMLDLTQIVAEIDFRVNNKFKRLADALSEEADRLVNNDRQRSDNEQLIIFAKADTLQAVSDFIKQEILCTR